jgi:hypothetical protein
MDDPRLRRIFEQLRASGFADLKGARVSVSMPLPERLLNEVVTAAVPSSAPVRDVTVHPQAANRLTVRARLKRADFLPPFTVKLAIERQPELPDSPLVLRVLTLPGLLSFAGSALSSMFPPGVRLENDRLLVDVKGLLERQGYGDVVTYLETLRIASEEGRLQVDATLRV